MLEKLDESSLTIAKAICGGSDNIDKEGNPNLNLFNVCSTDRLPDETKTLCNTIHMFAKVSCMDSYNNICNNIYNRG